MSGSCLDLLSPPRSLREVTVFCLKPQEQAQFQGRVTWARIILCFFTLSSFLPCCLCSDIVHLSQQVAVCPSPGHQEHQPCAQCVALARGPLSGTILQQPAGVSWSRYREALWPRFSPSTNRSFFLGLKSRYHLCDCCRISSDCQPGHVTKRLALLT